MVTPMARLPKKRQAQQHQRAVYNKHGAAHVQPRNKVDSKIEMPLVPPMAKAVGRFKKWMPAALIASPRFSKRAQGQTRPGSF